MVRDRRRAAGCDGDEQTGPAFDGRESAKPSIPVGLTFAAIVMARRARMRVRLAAEHG